ncbi:MAG: hypothetical protein K6G83_05220 [Lachnospiraceae bacterium]|nr:hypothetical protein [Lachnospiraceae bacterium]
MSETNNQATAIRVEHLSKEFRTKSGPVSDVFTNPKTAAAKRLIYVGMSEAVDDEEE